MNVVCECSSGVAPSKERRRGHLRNRYILLVALPAMPYTFSMLIGVGLWIELCHAVSKNKPRNHIEYSIRVRTKKATCEEPCLRIRTRARLCASRLSTDDFSIRYVVSWLKIVVFCFSLDHSVHRTSFTDRGIYRNSDLSRTPIVRNSIDHRDAHVAGYTHREKCLAIRLWSRESCDQVVEKFESSCRRRRRRRVLLPTISRPFSSPSTSSSTISTLRCGFSRSTGRLASQGGVLAHIQQWANAKLSKHEAQTNRSLCGSCVARPATPRHSIADNRGA